jgi:hypothetical protein
MPSPASRLIPRTMSVRRNIVSGEWGASFGMRTLSNVVAIADALTRNPALETIVSHSVRSVSS